MKTSDQQTSAMQYQVFVQNPSQQHFVASVVSLLGVAAEGQTKGEAGSFAVPKGNAKVKAMLKEKLAIGEFVTIGVQLGQAEPSEHPMQYAGIFADDPTFDN